MLTLHWPNWESHCRHTGFKISNFYPRQLVCFLIVVDNDRYSPS
uniref:Uncharacterized protein n=1 Tax=Lepeophtheirus salmonis TaxID=72036 RepID=A0A0K2UCM2_LEPSM